jgi:signal transduction histidine kinase
VEGGRLRRRYARPEVAPNRTNLLLDAGLALLAFALSLALIAVEDSHSNQLDAPTIALAALASLPLVARRRAPLSVFVFTTCASAALFAVATPAGPPVGPTIALYGVAAGVGESRAGQRVTLAVVVVMLTVHLAAVGLEEDSFPAMELVFAVVLWGGVWLAGERSRLRAERLKALEERALRAEREAERERRLAAAEERMRIARDLHDSAGHAINVILVHAGLGRLRTEHDAAGAREALETIEEVARETAGEIDQLVGVLRQDAASGEVEPPPGLAAVEELVARHRAAGLDVVATIEGQRRPLPPNVDRGAYRILQEALTNAARHGNGSAEVLVTFENAALEVTVTNPIGARATRQNGAGHGVVGMRERADLLGGSLEAVPQAGRFRVHAWLPVAPQ